MSSTHTGKSTTGRIVIPAPVRTAMTALGLVAPPLATSVARSLYFRPNRLRVRPEERAVLDRATSFRLASGAVVARSWGRGPVVALVHGWSGGLGQLTPFVAPLEAQGFQVVGFDWPGHGDSEGTTSSLLHAGRVMGELGALFGPLHGVIAHSFGAAATVYACARGLRADRLVLHAPVAHLTGYLARYTQALGFSDARTQAFIASCEQWLEQPFSAFDPVMNARKVQADALVIHSDDDREVSIDDGRELAKALGAPVNVKHGLGHRKLLRDGDCVRESVEFLAKRPALTSS